MKTTRASSRWSFYRRTAIIASTLVVGAVGCAASPPTDGQRSSSAALVTDDGPAGDGAYVGNEGSAEDDGSAGGDGSAEDDGSAGGDAYAGNDGSAGGDGYSGGDDSSDAGVCTCTPTTSGLPPGAYQPILDSLTINGTDGSTSVATVNVADGPNGDMLVDVSFVVQLATANESFNYDVYVAVNDSGDVDPSIPVYGALGGTDVSESQLYSDFEQVSWITTADIEQRVAAFLVAAAAPACKTELQNWMNTYATADAANDRGANVTLLATGIGAFGGPIGMLGGACIGLYNWESTLTPALKALKTARDNYKQCCKDNPKSPCCPAGQTATGAMPAGC